MMTRFSIAGLATLATLAIAACDPSAPLGYNEGVLPADFQAKVACADLGTKAGTNAIWKCSWGDGTPVCNAETNTTADGAPCDPSVKGVTYHATATVGFDWRVVTLKDGTTALDATGNPRHVCAATYTNTVYEVPNAEATPRLTNSNYATYGVLNAMGQLEFYSQSPGVTCEAAIVN